MGDPVWDVDGAADRDQDPEELLSTGKPLPAWVRGAAVALAVLVGGYLAVHAVLQGGGSGAPVAAAPATHSPQIAPPLFRSPGGPLRIDPVLICGDALGPLVSGSRFDPSTGLRLLVGGTRLRVVDFDTGRAVAVRGPRLRAGQWVSQLAVAAGRRYATTSGPGCGYTREQVFAVRGGARVLADVRPSQLVADESRVWTIVDPPHELRPLGHGRRITLPMGFAPVAATHGVIVGNLVDAMDSAEIVGVNGASGALYPAPGMGAILAAGHGRYVWSAGCTLSTDGPCELRTATVRGHALRTYRLPRPPGSSAGRLSPDGRMLAFTLAAAHVDPYHRQGNPSPASAVALLDLRTGRLTIVPGLELPSRYRPQFAFAPSGRWLVIAATDAGRTRLYAWRPGMGRPIASPLRDVPSPAPPPVQVLR